MPENLDDMLEGARRAHDVPALAAAVLKQGEIVARGAVGFRKDGAPQRVAPDDLWHLGSLTKAMTATLAARLVEHGKLDWQTNVPELFPELDNKIHQDYECVSLLEFLCHRAGIDGDIERLAIFPELRDSAEAVTDQRQAVLVEALAKPPHNAPGSAFEYSNLGYIIVGAMLERVSGLQWEELMRRELFGPLGMTQAGFGAPGDPDTVDQPWGHDVTPDGRQPVPPGPHADNVPALGPAGTVHCSLDDLARYASLHADKAVTAAPFLTPESLRLLHTPLPGFAYSPGWFVEETALFGPVLRHSGSNTLWYAALRIVPAHQGAVFTVTNQGGEVGGAATDTVANDLLLRVFDADQPKPG